MGDHNRQIRRVRIDVPLRSTCAYFFVDPDQGRWDPWWTALYKYLLRLAPDHLDWRYESAQNVYVARPQLTSEQRTDLARFLRSAPAREIEEHRTLRRAVGLTSEQQSRLELMYFSEGTECDEPAL